MLYRVLFQRLVLFHVYRFCHTQIALILSLSHTPTVCLSLCRMAAPTLRHSVAAADAAWTHTTHVQKICQVYSFVTAAAAVLLANVCICSSFSFTYTS